MKRVVKNTKFGYFNNTFINLYSAENPSLSANDRTYFLFNNISDVQRPLIGIGTIRVDKYLDSMNKVYYIELEEIFEPDYIIDKFLFNKKTMLFNAYNGNEITTSQKVSFLNKTKLPTTDPKFFKDNLLQVEAFFVRPTLDEIRKLQIEYMQVIKDDLKDQLEDINLLLLDYGITE